MAQVGIALLVDAAPGIDDTIQTTLEAAGITVYRVDLHPDSDVLFNDDEREG